MIRKCSESDRELLLNYCNKDKVMNLFVIGDILSYGVVGDSISFYIDYNDEIDTLYMVFRDNLVISSYKRVFNKEFINSLILKYGINNINGDYETTKKLELDGFNQKKTFIASLTKLNKICDFSSAIELSYDDVETYINSSAKVFGSIPYVKKEQNDYLNNLVKIYGYKVDGKLVSGAKAVAETNDSCMVVGVYTLEEYRNNHYALKTVSKLCSEYLKKDKTVCLFFDNPHAAKMYHKIGFKDVGEYGLISKNK